MAFGSLDARGIWKYGEDDTEATFSALLNKGMTSVSDATKIFSGTATERAALTPPEGAIWVDTDSDRRIWEGRGGAWVDFRSLPNDGVWTVRRIEGNKREYTVDVSSWTSSVAMGSIGTSNYVQQVGGTYTKPSSIANWSAVNISVDVIPMTGDGTTPNAANLTGWFYQVTTTTGTLRVSNLTSQSLTAAQTTARFRVTLTEL